MSPPLVSIVIPCYNRENYISDAINSALNQTYSNIEIIIVDDGSIDKSVAVIESFGDKVTLLKQKNSGVNSARNAGFQKSNGEFIIFLDSDDWLSSDIIEKHIETTIKWPLASIYCADSVFIDVNGKEKELTRCNWPDKPACPIDLFLLTPPPFPACELYRTSVVHKHGGYDESMRAFADSDLRLRIMLSGDATFVRTDGGHGAYRPVENSITKNTLRLHKYAVKLIKKLSKRYSLDTPKLESLLIERLLRHRMRWWNSILSFHTSLTPLSIGKFLWHLIRVSRVDLGYIIFIFRDKPWTIDKNRYF
jgi:glycosyltransferase involved in cell wall biosynthesis